MTLFDLDLDMHFEESTETYGDVAAAVIDWMFFDGNVSEWSGELRILSLSGPAGGAPIVRFTAEEPIIRAVLAAYDPEAVFSDWARPAA